MGVPFTNTDGFSRLIELTPDLRRQIEATIAQLIDLLDQYDSDGDGEEDGSDEPLLGWTDAEIRNPAYHACDDRELEDEHDEEGHDAEPEEGMPI